MANMKTILLTGASGMLGRELYRQLAERSTTANPQPARVIGWCGRRCTDPQWKSVDLRSETEIIKALTDANVCCSAHNCQRTIQPDVIIHSAAIRRPDEIKNDVALAQDVNVMSVRVIAEYVGECHEDG